MGPSQAVNEHSKSKQSPGTGVNDVPGLDMEPPRGFEPRTYALRVRCSTTELRRRAHEEPAHVTGRRDSPLLADQISRRERPAE